MATDIAFAVGVVAVLGARVPPALKLFLLTLAIADDVGAIVVIAVFYSSDLDLPYLAAAVALVAVMLVLRRARLFWLPLYLVLGTSVWLATRGSGIHPTIAGVVLGLLAPLAPSSAWPAERLERLLHPWSSFVIVPLFALANAGIAVSTRSFTATGAAVVTAGVVVGLVVGKVVGISAGAWLAVRTGAGRLPEGTTWPMVVGIAATGGIGFTVSLLIADLAFAAGPLREAAKVGVLGASVLAAGAGVLILRWACRRA
jgi:NhaA family Na+:H+ antiporter